MDSNLSIVADTLIEAANQGLEIAKIYWHICCR